MSLRVLVVDDTVIFRRIVSDALAGLPGIEVVGAASNGRLALSRMAALHPDLVTLDIEMPEMNGIEVLEAMGPAGLKAGVIVLSALTVRGGEMTVRALELGAFDFITKPEGGPASANLAALRQQLAPVVRAFERRRDVRVMLRSQPIGAIGPTAVRPARTAPPTPEAPFVRRPRNGPPLVLIGVSTGGPGRSWPPCCQHFPATWARRFSSCSICRRCSQSLWQPVSTGSARFESRRPRMARSHSRTVRIWLRAASK